MRFRRAVAVICGCAAVIVAYAIASGTVWLALDAINCYYFPGSTPCVDEKVADAAFRRAIFEGVGYAAGAFGLFAAVWLLTRRSRTP